MCVYLLLRFGVRVCLLGGLLDLRLVAFGLFSFVIVCPMFVVVCGEFVVVCVLICLVCDGCR